MHQEGQEGATSLDSAAHPGPSILLIGFVVVRTKSTVIIINGNKQASLYACIDVVGCLNELMGLDCAFPYKNVFFFYKYKTFIV